MSVKPEVITSLPLFPLRTVLCPGGVLPLQIFEVRYLDMIGKCYKTGDPFGVVALERGSEVRRRSQTEQPGSAATGEAFEAEVFFAIGTLARITALETPQSGLMLLRCQGYQRFFIRRREQLKHGLWIADVDLIAADQSVHVPSDLQNTASALKQVITDLQQRGVTPDQMPFGAPYQLDDCAWVSNRWCELLPLPLEVKQRLMALENPLIRLELVRDMLNPNR